MTQYVYECLHQNGLREHSHSAGAASGDPDAGRLAIRFVSKPPTRVAVFDAAGSLGRLVAENIPVAGRARFETIGPETR